MAMNVMAFQEEAASLHSIPELQGATARAMVGIDLPYFNYAWSRSSSLDSLDMDDDSFFATFSGEFFSTYIKTGLYRNDYSIYACRGTTTIPSLIGRTYHRWRDVPPDELNASERAVEDLGKAYFVDGLTGRIENHDGLFFAGASVVGQGMSLREFNHALLNAGAAFQFLRIYHDRFHLLRRAEPVIQIRESELRSIVAAMRRGDVDSMDNRIAGLIGRASEAMNSVFAHSPGYDQVTLRGKVIRFGPIQARIIGILHAAVLTAVPWVRERELMDEARSASRNLHDAFRHHDHDFLFETDSFGRVRLRL